MSLETRYRIRNMISQRLGFDFKEENLSPKLRRDIGLMSQKLYEYDQFVIRKTQQKSQADNYSFAASFLVVIGAFSLMFALSGHYSAVVLGSILFALAFVPYRIHRGSLTKAKRMELEANTMLSEIVKQIDKMSESAFKELTDFHESLVRPTVKHITVDFADIIQTARERGIILSTVECPYCKGAVEIPPSGEYFKCRYCAKTIHATNILDKLKDL